MDPTQYQLQIAPDGQQIYVPIQEQEDEEQEQAIDEVSPEQEDNESQNQPTNILPASNIADDLSTE